MPKRAYIDTSVLIAAFQGKGALGRRALEVLDDPERALIVSDAVRLESLPKARYNKQGSEVACYEAVFNRADNLPWDSAALQNAHKPNAMVSQPWMPAMWRSRLQQM